MSAHDNISSTAMNYSDGTVDNPVIQKLSQFQYPEGKPFRHHTGDSRFWLSSIPILRENTLSQGLPLLFLFHQPHERTCSSAAIMSTSMTQRALYIFKHPCLLRDSSPDPTAVSVTKHYTE
ncbi:hypothetical protein TNCV_1953731 [Trichonephila clavipes]|nr:hypothetical protein TNCV_1953731 [Trichonephila clavipes]